MTIHNRHFFTWNSHLLFTHLHTLIKPLPFLSSFFCWIRYDQTSRFLQFSQHRELNHPPKYHQKFNSIARFCKYSNLVSLSLRTHTRTHRTKPTPTHAHLTIFQMAPSAFQHILSYIYPIYTNIYIHTRII